MASNPIKDPRIPIEFGDPTGCFALALNAAGQAVFDWELNTDTMSWSDAAAPLLGISSNSKILTGRDFLSHLSKDGLRDRASGVQNAASGHPTYCVEYLFQPSGLEPRWVEEIGTFVRESDGRISRLVGLIRNVSKRRLTESRLAFLSSYDELTGNLNRSSLCDRLDQVIEVSKAEDQPAAYFVARVDDMAAINDAYGFDAANDVICVISQVIRSVLGEAGVIGRHAGNKLGIILPSCNKDQLTERVNELRSMVRTTVAETRAGSVSATISVGAVSLPFANCSGQMAMGYAEEALERAKNSTGRDAFRIYEHSEETASARRRSFALADKVVSALNERRFALAYQPIVSTHDGNVALYESLLRIAEPDGSVTAAGQFIQVAEQRGLIRLVDQRALELALTTLKTYPSARLALNVSGMTVSDPSWLDAFLGHIKANRELASRLTLEITETVAIKDVELSQHFVNSVRELGCRIAIDDFGAGYTSFRSLQSLVVDLIKIDGGYVRDISNKPQNMAFLRAMLDLASHFDVPIVAECVESADDVRILKEQGVHFLQGFYLGKPSMDPPWTSASDQSADDAIGSNL